MRVLVLLPTLSAIVCSPRSGGSDLARAPDGWRRQYVGLIRGGGRFVYGSFFPTGSTRYGDLDRWPRELMNVCDGEPVFFGVEYDVEGRRVTHVAFDGMA